MRLIDADELVKRFKELKGIDSLSNMFITDVIKEIKNQPTVYDMDEEMAAAIKQAIEYFKDELSQMGVFSDIISFREAEVRACRTAIKVLQGIQEGSQKGQQDGSRQCATSHG